MQPDDLLEAADEMAIARGMRKWRALMLTLVDILSDVTLPAAVGSAFETARAQWSQNRQSEKALLESKSICWSYLRGIPPPDLAHPDGRSVRALLCVLEPDGDDQAASDTAEWFVEMVEGSAQ